jgi:putative peptidoglycan lipid II flippase
MAALHTGTTEDVPTRPARYAWGRIRSATATLLPRSAVVLSLLTFAGYAMGVVRDRAFARTYGAGSSLDAYNAAFVLPELALDVLVAGGLIAPFVPLFTQLRDKAAGDAQAFGRTVLTYAIVLMAAVCVLLFIFAPQTVDLIVPGFQGDQRDLYVSLFRLMCVTPVVFAISIVLGEILVAEQRFAWYGLAALMYNGGIAAGTLLLSGPVGIYGAAIGALVGSFLHLGVRLVGIMRATSFRPRPRFNLRTNGFGEFSRLMVPKMVKIGRAHV